ncbi:MAG: ATP-binding cassette domain-containing protein [Oscillibacter sp.]|nr:ATP-binding cassette domain-containing protein [Oscillibacter sp.]
MPTIRLEEATKFYMEGRRKIDAVRGIDLTIKQGEFVFITGSSGAGKSTLLKLLCGIAKPDCGMVYFNESNMARAMLLSGDRIRQQFGYVPQTPMLMHRRTIEDNLTAVARSKGLLRRRDVHSRVKKVLGIVGLSGIEKVYPAELSGGERRRVELARALINSPPILALDEVTANLDEDNIWDIFHLLTELNRQGTTVIMATHASLFVNLMRQRVITLVDGKVAGDVCGGKYGDIPKKDDTAPDPPF